MADMAPECAAIVLKSRSRVGQVNNNTAAVRVRVREQSQVEKIVRKAGTRARIDSQKEVEGMK